jgi:hypothetical protein
MSKPSKMIVNGKALPHVVTALIDKRREIAGKIENLQQEVIRLTVELDHIESSLRIFKPDLDLAGFSPRPVPPAHHAFRGEVSRILLTALREADRPLSTTELTRRVMQERHLNLKDVKLKQVMGRRIGASLNHWKRVRGALESLKGPGQVLYWQLKPVHDGFDVKALPNAANK